jgi:hypothetical protein
VEALACGTPAVAPAYDGFRNTLEGVPGCRLVPTRQGADGIEPDGAAFVDAVAARLAETDDGESTAASCARAAARFERTTSLRAMVEVLRDRPPAASPPLGERPFTVQGCAPCVHDLFGDLEGHSSATLLEEVLSTGAAPIPVAAAPQRGLERAWFAHY